MKINDVELTDDEYAFIYSLSEDAKNSENVDEYFKKASDEKYTSEDFWVLANLFQNESVKADYESLRKLNLSEPIIDEPAQYNNPIKPSHYQDSSGHDLFWHFKNGLLTHDEYVGFLKGNVFKYTKRYQSKNGLEDLNKANEYLRELTEFEFGTN